MVGTRLDNIQKTQQWLPNNSKQSLKIKDVETTATKNGFIAILGAHLGTGRNLWHGGCFCMWPTQPPHEITSSTLLDRDYFSDVKLFRKEM